MLTRLLQLAYYKIISKIIYRKLYDFIRVNEYNEPLLLLNEIIKGQENHSFYLACKVMIYAYQGNLSMFTAQYNKLNIKQRIEKNGQCYYVHCIKLLIFSVTTGVPEDDLQLLKKNKIYFSKNKKNEFLKV